MTRNIFIKHKELEMICKESGLVITNYHALKTHPKSKPITQSIITYTTIKQQLTCSKCGKIGHAKNFIITSSKKNLWYLLFPPKLLNCS